METDRDLQEAFVAAFEPYVRARLSEIGVGDVARSEPLTTAIREGSAWLDHQLTSLFATDAVSQRQSPLALFQAALSYPTDTLRTHGVPMPERDPAAAAALPGDAYDLAPASSQVLGDAAWKAHVAWGVRKAQAVAGVVPVPATPSAEPQVALVGNDLMDRSKVESAATAAGCSLVVWRNPGAVATGIEQGRPSVVFVDLTHPAADEIISTIAAHGLAIVAFGPHVDDVAMARAGALGADTVVPRSRFFAKLGEYLPKLA